jgi:hypothetical protein
MSPFKHSHHVDNARQGGSATQASRNLSLCFLAHFSRRRLPATLMANKNSINVSKKLPAHVYLESQYPERRKKTMRLLLLRTPSAMLAFYSIVQHRSAKKI